MRRMYSGMRSSSVVTVADSHFVSSMELQNTSGRPNDGSLRAIFFHRSHADAGPRFSVAAVWWSPSSELSTSEPIVIRT